MYHSNIQLLINGKSRENVHSGQRSRGFRDGHCRDNIQLLINGKSRENVHSGQRSRGFRDGHCRV